MKPFEGIKVLMQPNTGELSLLFCEGGQLGPLQVFRVIHEKRLSKGWTKLERVVERPKGYIYLGRL